MQLRAHPSVNPQQHVLGTVLPDAQYLQQSATINLPAYVNRIYILPRVPDHLMDRHFSLWVLIDKQLVKASQHAIPDLSPHDPAFEVMLHPGVNVIEAHMIAAIPAIERVEGGSDAELEIFTAFVNVAKV